MGTKEEELIQKINRLMKEKERIRNIGTIAHVDHGKF